VHRRGAPGLGCHPGQPSFELAPVDEAGETVVGRFERQSVPGATLLSLIADHQNGSNSGH
jgi:hypothetical protein